MTAALAASPILLVLGLMLGLNWSAAKAGGLAFALAIALALLAFEMAPGGIGGEILALTGALAEAGFTTATILWIIFPALAVHALQTRTGALDTMRGALSNLSDDPLVATLLIGWFFALFIEGAAGFGAPVALAAPLLVGLGMKPERALIITLIGHAAGVSFGAVGTPILPLLAVTEFSPAALAVWPALLHGALAWILVAILLASLGVRGIAQWGTAALAAALFLAPFVAIALLVGPELPTLLGALLGGLAFVAIIRQRGDHPGKAGPRQRDLLRAAAPYLALVALVVATRLVPAFQETLSALRIAWTWQARFSGTFAPLYHPGTMIAAAFVVGALLQRAPRRQVAGALTDAALKLVPVTVALLAMLGLARVLVHAGMVDALALAAAEGIGPAWPLAAPFIGALGTFVTGSATASNILFAELQLSVASELGLSALAILGAQTFGAAVGNIACPHNIVAGAATVGAMGCEGAILRRTLPVCLLYAAAGGLLAWVVIG
ncbi:MAG: L-lactate permease [Pseudomonadota bacterium]